MRKHKILFGGQNKPKHQTINLLTRKHGNIVTNWAQEELSGKKLYVVDGYAGANEDTGLQYDLSWRLHGRLIL